MIFTKNHRFDRVDIPMRKQGETEVLPVIIGDDVWLGARVLLLPGARVGSGSVIGAGAVVSGEIPPMSVAVGNPARVVKRREE
jgi:maltose O-acetyltransferase